MNKDAFYFPHFSNARNDRKLRRLRKQLGIEGYAIYFMILEVLREQESFKYPLEDIDLLADDFGTSEEKVKTVINNYNLFKKDEENFFSFKFNEYLKPYLQVKQNRKIAGIKGNLIKYKYRTKEQLDGLSDFEIIELNNKRDTLAIAKPSQSDRNASQSKVKESKVKESKVKEITPPNKSAKSEIVKALFDKFWNSYNKKVGKPKSLEYFKKLNIKEMNLAITKALLLADCTEKKFRKDPERWLRDKRFTDEIIKPETNKTDSSNKNFSKQWSHIDKTEKYEHEKIEGYEPMSEEEIALIDNMPF